MNGVDSLAVLREIRNWIRASSFPAVKAALESALPNSKDRLVYQMSDGTRTNEKIRITSKTSPNHVVALQARCVALGLMEIGDDNRRHRLFDLQNFGLLASESTEKASKNR